MNKEEKRFGEERSREELLKEEGTISMDTDYGLLTKQIKELVGEDKFLLSSLSNISAVLFQELPKLNWAGFYLLKENYLYLGPFQGKPACVEIEAGRGVCGTAVSQDRIQRVADVHKFEGHIACDASSRSEIVLPIHFKGTVVGVLDIDSYITERFSEKDEAGLKKIVELIETIWRDLF